MTVTTEPLLTFWTLLKGNTMKMKPWETWITHNRVISVVIYSLRTRSTVPDSILSDHFQNLCESGPSIFWEIFLNALNTHIFIKTRRRYSFWSHLHIFFFNKPLSGQHSFFNLPVNILLGLPTLKSPTLQKQKRVYSYICFEGMLSVNSAGFACHMPMFMSIPSVGCTHFNFCSAASWISH